MVAGAHGRYYDAGMGQVKEFRTRTDSRVASVLAVLRKRDSWTYEDVRLATGGEKRSDGSIVGGVAYDILLYIFATLEAVGMITRTHLPNREGPGAPRAQFEWVDRERAQAVGAWAA